MRPLDAAGGLALLVCVGVAAVDTTVNPWFNDLPWATTVPLLLAAGAARRGARIGAASALVGALAWAASAPRPTAEFPTRVLVYGIDGATFDVIDQERLPALEAMAADGARATLRSTEPMFSPLLWTTIASGRSPDEHGIRGFRVHADDCRVARFWDVAEHAGWRIGLWKWLVDYPPRQIEGFWVPSWLAPGTETWPTRLSVVKEVELSRRTRRRTLVARQDATMLAWGLVREGMRLGTLAQAIGWSVAGPLLPSERAEIGQQLLRGWIDRDVFVAQLHRERPELATFTYYAVDAIGHRYWHLHEAGGSPVRMAYRAADAILGELRAEMPGARVIVVSDHGFQPMRGATGANGPAGRFRPRTERLRERLSAQAGVPVDVTRVGQKLTVAMPTGTSSAAVAVVRAWLEALRGADGAPVYRLEEIAEGMWGLTLANEQLDATRMATDTVGDEPLASYVALEEAYTGTHEARGIFLAAGEGVRRGAQLAEVTLLDVTPTILAAAGLPASREMPGRNVIEGWREPPRVDDHDALLTGLRWIDGREGVDEERLRALGYAE
jgi:hypothetical protein